MGAGFSLRFTRSAVVYGRPAASKQLGLGVSAAQHLRGNGFLGGLAPAGPGGEDGRLRILNEPSRARILVFERGTTICAASTLSKPDGTWVIHGLDPDRHFTVLATDDQGRANAAVQDWVRPAPYDD